MINILPTKSIIKCDVHDEKNNLFTTNKNRFLRPNKNVT